MTYLEELQATLTKAQADHENASQWLEQGATINHSRLELERAERETADRLEQATAELNAYLQCPLYASHRPVEFTWCGYRNLYTCECPDCRDGDSDGRCNEVGYGKTESEAFADYMEREGL